MKIFLFFVALFLFFFQWQRLEKNFFDFSQVDPHRKEIRFLVLHQEGVGEKEFIQKLQIGAKRLGWECYSCSTRIPFWGKIFSNPLLKVIKTLNADFTLNFQSKALIAPGINFLSLSSGANLYFGPDKYLDLSTIAPFDAFLPTFAKTSLLQEGVEKIKGSYVGMRWFFTSPKQPYQKIVPKRLFYCGANWDPMRKTGKYHALFKLLDQENLIDLYGPKNSWKHFSNSYRGILPFDGKSVQAAMQERGIVLILHSESHIKGNAPTARIFEAAAASCLIISDLHPFIQEEFGDAVLYIDQTLPPELISAQIKRHLCWIKEHPDEATALAKRAHEIFEKKFSLEEQLQKLKQLYLHLSA